MVLEIDPMVDFACKMLLGNPDYPQITIHFLNSVLRFSSPIVSVEIINPIMMQEFDSDKLSILDVLAVDDAARRLNVEVQRTRRGSLPERMSYYAATQLVNQLGEGDSYLKLRPSIGICILKSVLFTEASGYHQQFRLRTAGGLELTNCLEIHVLELPKYAPAEDNEAIDDPCDQWMYFFRKAKGSTPEQLLSRLRDPIFIEAIGIMEMISRKPEQRRAYDARLKWELDENTRIEEAKADKAYIEESKAYIEETKAYIEEAMAYIEESKAQGEARGKIKALQELLRLPISPDAEFEGKSLEELRQWFGQLQEQLGL